MWQLYVEIVSPPKAMSSLISSATAATKPPARSLHHSNLIDAAVEYHQATVSASSGLISGRDAELVRPLLDDEKQEAAAAAAASLFSLAPQLKQRHRELGDSAADNAESTLKRTGEGKTNANSTKPTDELNLQQRERQAEGKSGASAEPRQDKEESDGALDNVSLASSPKRVRNRCTVNTKEFVATILTDLETNGTVKSPQVKAPESRSKRSAPSPTTPAIAHSALDSLLASDGDEKSDAGYEQEVALLHGPKNEQRPTALGAAVNSNKTVNPLRRGETATPQKEEASGAYADADADNDDDNTTSSTESDFQQVAAATGVITSANQTTEVPAHVVVESTSSAGAPYDSYDYNWAPLMAYSTVDANIDYDTAAAATETRPTAHNLNLNQQRRQRQDGGRANAASNLGQMNSLFGQCGADSYQSIAASDSCQVIASGEQEQQQQQHNFLPIEHLPVVQGGEGAPSFRQGRRDSSLMCEAFERSVRATTGGSGHSSQDDDRQQEQNATALSGLLNPSLLLVEGYPAPSSHQTGHQELFVAAYTQHQQEPTPSHQYCTTPSLVGEQPVHAGNHTYHHHPWQPAHYDAQYEVGGPEQKPRHQHQLAAHNQSPHQTSGSPASSHHEPSPSSSSHNIRNLERDRVAGFRHADDRAHRARDQEYAHQPNLYQQHGVIQYSYTNESANFGAVMRQECGPDLFTYKPIEQDDRYYYQHHQHGPGQDQIVTSYEQQPNTHQPYYQQHNSQQQHDLTHLSYTEPHLHAEGQHQSNLTNQQLEQHQTQATYHLLESSANQQQHPFEDQAGNNQANNYYQQAPCTVLYNNQQSGYATNYETMPIVSGQYDPSVELRSCLRQFEFERDDEDDDDDDDDEEQDQIKDASETSANDQPSKQAKASLRTSCNTTYSDFRGTSSRLSQAPVEARDAAQKTSAKVGCSKETLSKLRAFIERRMKLKLMDESARCSPASSLIHNATEPNHKQQPATQQAKQRDLSRHDNALGQQQRCGNSYPSSEARLACHYASTYTTATKVLQRQPMQNQHHHQHQQQQHQQPLLANLSSPTCICSSSGLCPYDMCRARRLSELSQQQQQTHIQENSSASGTSACCSTSIPQLREQSHSNGNNSTRKSHSVCSATSTNCSNDSTDCVELAPLTSAHSMQSDTNQGLGTSTKNHLHGGYSTLSPTSNVIVRPRRKSFLMIRSMDIDSNNNNQETGLQDKPRSGSSCSSLSMSICGEDEKELNLGVQTRASKRRRMQQQQLHNQCQPERKQLRRGSSDSISACSVVMRSPLASTDLRQASDDSMECDD